MAQTACVCTVNGPGHLEQRVVVNVFTVVSGTEIGCCS